MNKVELEQYLKAAQAEISEGEDTRAELREELAKVEDMVRGLRSERQAMRKSFTRKLKEAISTSDAKRQKTLEGSTENYDVLLIGLAEARRNARQNLVSAVTGVSGKAAATAIIDLVNRLAKEIE